MAKQLTVQGIQRLKRAPIKRIEKSDAGAPGLYLIVQPTGKKSWAFRYRFHGKTYKLTLGTHYAPQDGEAQLEPIMGGALTLLGARQLARMAANDLARGFNPALSLRRPELPKGDGFATVADNFIQHHLKTLRSGREVERMLRRDVLPRWRDKQIQGIDRRDVVELMMSLRDDGVGPMRNRVFALVRKLFNWAITEGVVETKNPCANLKAPAEEKSRDRVLSDDEIRWFWRACDDLDYPFGQLFKLLLLTGQRLSEVANITTAEINLAQCAWTIPRERAKNDTANIVPLSEQVLEILKRLERINGKAGYLFTTTGETPVSGFSRAKAKVEKAMLAFASEDCTPIIPEWRLHDLRRTFATGMQRLGQPIHVVESILNHKSGTIRGVAAVYARYAYAPEKQKALEAWGRFVSNLVSEQPVDNVVALTG